MRYSICFTGWKRLLPCTIFTIGWLGIGVPHALALNVHLRESFDAGKAPGRWRGILSSDKPYKGSAGCWTAEALKDNKWFGMRMAYNPKEPMGVLAADTVLYLAYFLEETANVKVQLSTDKGTIFTNIRKPVVGKWTTVTLPLTSFRTGYKKTDPKAEPGRQLKSLYLYAGKPNTKFTWKVDEVCVTSGGLPTDIAAQIAAHDARVQETTGTFQTTGYRLSLPLVEELKKKFTGEGVKSKTIMVFGANTARSNYFLRPLHKKALSRGAGYSFVRGSAGTGPNKTAGWAAKQAQKKLKIEKPEIAFIMLLETEYKNSRLQAFDAEAQLGRLVSLCIAQGTLPVLYTLPLKKLPLGPAGQRYNGFNKVIDKIATNNGLPVIDAGGLLTLEDKKAQRKLWTGRRPSQAGYNRLNNVSLQLYRVLEEHVFGRKQTQTLAGAAAPAGRGGVIAAAAAEDEDEDDEPARPRKKPRGLFE